MRDYDPQIQYDMPQDDGATEKQIAATNDIAQTVLQGAEGFLQKKVDQQQTQQGAKDAAKQGAKFVPASDLTAAGRAYNSGAQPIELSNIGSMLQNTMQQQYLATKQQPLNEDALRNFNAQSSKANEQYINTLDPNYRSYATQISNKIQQSYGMRLSNDIANNYIASDKQNKITAVTQGINTSSQLYANAASISDLKKYQQSIQDANNQYLHTRQTIDSIADPRTRAVATSNLNQNAISTIVNSQYQRLLNIANRTPINSEQRTASIAQLESYSKNFLKNNDVKQQLSALGLMDDKGIVPTMSQGLFLRLQNNLQAHNKSLLQGAGVSRENNDYAKSNVIANALNGVPASPQMLSTFNTKDLNQYSGNLFVHSHFKMAQQDGYNAVINLQNQIRSGNLDGDFDAFSPIEKQQVLSSLAKMSNEYITNANKDPAVLLQGSPAVANQTKNIANTLTGDDQVQFKKSMANPSFLFSQRLSPKAAQAVQDNLNFQASLQVKHGLKPEIITNNQALAFKSSLSTMPNLDQAKALQILRLNTGSAFGSLETSLLKQKLPYQNIVASRVLDSDPELANEMIQGGQLLTDKDTVDQFLASKGMNSTQALLVNDSGLQKTLQNIAPGTSQSALAQRKGYEETILSVALQRYKDTGTAPKLDDINTEVFNKLYQNDPGDSFSVPYYYTGHNGARIPIDLQTVKNQMAYMKTTEYIKNEASFSGQKNDIYSHEMYANNVSNGHWVNAPNGNGFLLKDMYGRYVKFKDGSYFSFTFDSTNPHNLSKEYMEFVKKRGLF